LNKKNKSNLEALPYPVSNYTGDKNCVVLALKQTLRPMEFNQGSKNKYNSYNHLIF
jgi:hypothetical protein